MWIKWKITLIQSNIWQQHFDSIEKTDNYWVWSAKNNWSNSDKLMYCQSYLFDHELNDMQEIICACIGIQ